MNKLGKIQYFFPIGHVVTNFLFTSASKGEFFFFPPCAFFHILVSDGEKNWVNKRYFFPLSFDIILSLFTSAYLEEKLDIFLPLPHLGGKKY